MDSTNPDDGGGKKKGLARLAKNRNLSSSWNNLQFIDEKDPSSPHTTQRVPDSPSDQQGSPLRNLNKQSAAVNLLPNKLNLSEISKLQPGERRVRAAGMEEDSISLDSAGLNYVPCSDPDFIRNSKSGVIGTQSLPLTSAKSSTGGLEKQEGKASVGKATSVGKRREDASSNRTPKKSSPLLSRRAQLAPPQVKRSSSMTRLTEAINQIHNICVFPAQPVTIVQKNEEMSERNVQKVYQSPSAPMAQPEVNGSVPLTPLTAANTRTDKARTQSPKLMRRTAFRETVKEHRKKPSESSVPCASQYGSNNVVLRCDPTNAVHSHSVSSPNYVPQSSADASCLENGFGAAHPTRTKQSSASSKASSSSSESSGISSSRNGRSSCRSHAKERKRTKQKNSEEVPDVFNHSSDSPTLKHASSAPNNLMIEDDQFLSDASYHHPTLEQSPLNRSPSWSGYKKSSPRSGDSEESKDHTVPGAPLQGCRSASLDELSNIDLSYGLPIISPVDAKKKNYLFGGLNSLLGASELDRYFPSRTVSLFIATWNMNGKEPPVNLEAFLLPDQMDHMPDMFVIGTQESGGSRSEWEVRLQATIGPTHVLFTSAIFGVLHLIIFLRRDLVWFCSVPEESTYSLRPGIAYKTKGGVAIGFQFFGTRMLFINSHLTAHEEKQALRIQNFRNISRSLDLPRLLPLKHKHKDVTHRYDSVFWLGDLNFRLAVNRDHVFERLKRSGPETYKHLLQWDQLSQARQKGEAFSDFEEGSIVFAPTFKYDPGTDHYDTSSKQRVPSYTDRILFKSKRGDVACSSYDSCSMFRTSDHKPVLGSFSCKIRPGKDDVPLAAGSFNRDVYLEALRRRRRFLYQPSFRNCPVQ